MTELYRTKRYEGKPREVNTRGGPGQETLRFKVHGVYKTPNLHELSCLRNLVVVLKACDAAQLAKFI